MKILRFLELTILAGLPFGLLWGGFMRWQMGPELGVGAGATAGLLFGLAMAGFQAWMRSPGRRDVEMPLELQPGEVIEHQGPANHKLGPEYRGGWLFLTDQRVAFRPHSLNVQQDPLDLDRRSVTEVAMVQTLWLVPNGLLLVTRDGTEHRFVVSGRASWKEAFEGRLDPDLPA